MARGRVNNEGLTAIGDSVLLGIRFHLEKSIRGVEMDAEVGRQPSGVLERLRDLQAENLLAPTVLMQLGTNGYVTEHQLRKSLTALSDRHLVILVNAHAPRRWVDANNEMLARVVPDYSNAVLIDWAGGATAHPEFFVSDDIHLTAIGQRVFVNAVKCAGNFPAVPPPLPKTVLVSEPEPDAAVTEPVTAAEGVVVEPAVGAEPVVVTEPAVVTDPAAAPAPEDSKPVETPEAPERILWNSQSQWLTAR